MNKSEILFGASKSLFIKAVGLISAYLFAFVVSRIFGAQVWGEFSLALVIILFGVLIGTAGLDMAIVKLTASHKSNREIRATYKLALFGVSVLSLLASVLIYLMSEWIAGTLFQNPGLKPIFKIAAFAVFPLSIINLNISTLQGLQRINKYVLIRFVFRHIAALLFLLILILFLKQDSMVLISYVAGLYLVVFLSFYWLTREDIHPFRLFNKHQVNSVEYKRLFKLSLPLMLAGSLVFWNSWIDTIMVGAFLTEFDVGVYSMSLKISSLLLFFWTSVSVVVTPKISSLYSQKKMLELQYLVRYSSSIIFFSTLPLFVILVFLPEPILSIFGEEFTKGKNALIILSFGYLASSWAGLEGYFMQMTDSQFAFQNITLISTLLAFLLNYFLIPVYGIEGAALATCISVIFWKWSGVLYIKYRYGIITAYMPFRKSDE